MPPFHTNATVPKFSVSTNSGQGSVAHTLVVVTGAVSGSASGGNFSTESLQELFFRVAGFLGGISGVSGGTNQMLISLAQLSGLRNIQRELCLRFADLAVPDGDANAAKLASATAILTASGEVRGATPFV